MRCSGSWPTQEARWAAAGNGADPTLARDLVVAHGYCRHAAERCNGRLAALFRNSDAARIASADAMLQLPEPGND